jgi:hypothetical protein
MGDVGCCRGGGFRGGVGGVSSRSTVTLRERSGSQSLFRDGGGRVSSEAIDVDLETKTQSNGVSIVVVLRSIPDFVGSCLEINFFQGICTVFVCKLISPVVSIYSVLDNIFFVMLHRHWN